ncbi:MAG: alkaline phosphatase family protein [Sphingobacteriales bacterium]|nr:MAG: alkaline phosphatase family protein [Sphingobacteriales bacterium]
MKSSTILCVFFLSFPFFGATQKIGSKDLQRPKLVVGIVVDQMRWDYLYRFYNRYTETGFKRLLREGFSCENTLIDYVPTVTAIGHSTVYTGSVPAIHGIAGNDFIINASGKTVYCTEDRDVQTVGSSSKAGEMSPRNLLASTITDELKLATNFKSKVIGIALKDRGAILPAGHAADGAYWFDNVTGNFITSTWYMKELPQWVKNFNSQKLPEKYLKQDWNTLYDINTYDQSTPDDTKYEGLVGDKKSPVFPINTSQMFSRDYDIIRVTPHGNTLTLDMAKAAIENEFLGQDDVTDFLTISFSSPDYVGHKFGVNAIETEDVYLRLDRNLGDLFRFLDTQIGKGKYTLFLTADHGAAHNINFLTDNKIPSARWSGNTTMKELNKQLEQKLGVKNIVSSLMNYQVHLNYRLIDSSRISEDEVRQLCVNALRKMPDISFAADMDKIGEASIPWDIKQKMINGYNIERSGCIQFALKPAVASAGSSGTTHGSWNPYDSHIPLLWMGWGIKSGSTNRPTGMIDIAPTLAALLHIQMPNGSIGKPVVEIFTK